MPDAQVGSLIVMTTPDVPRQPGLTTLAAAADDASDPITRVDALHALAAATTTALESSVSDARVTGASWSLIGASLGISKQAAAKRYATPATPTTPTTQIATSDRTPEDNGTGPPKASEPRAKAAAGHHGWDLQTPHGRLILKLRRAR